MINSLLLDFSADFALHEMVVMGPDRLLACLIHWIGRATIDYAAEKASIGMTCQELVYEYPEPVYAYPIKAMTEYLNPMETPDEYIDAGVSLRVQKAHAALRRASELLVTSTEGEYQ